MPPDSLDVLVVEDNPGDVDLLTEYLRDSRLEWRLTVATTLCEAVQLMEERAFDVVLLDLGLPDSQGMETLSRLQESPVRAPVVVLTGHADSALAWEAVDEGAHDYLPKDEMTPGLLERCLRYAVGRSRAEEELRRQKERFRTLLDLSVMGIYMIDSEGRFRYANRRLADILGYEPEEIVDRSTDDFAVGEDRALVRDTVEERIRGQAESAHYTLRARTRGGDVVELEVHGRAIEIDGEPMILGALRDISEKKELERQLMHSQKVEAVGRLAGGVAHDFNNLLTVVAGNCELLARELPETDDRREFLEEIRDAAERATALTRQLLIFSRRDTVRTRTVDLHEIIRGTERLLTRLLAEDIRMTLDLEARESFVRADPGRLEQLVMNLVLNAQDAMPEGGRLWIQTTDDPDRARAWDPSLVPEPDEGSHLYLRIADSGHGIDPEIRDRIYDPFFTTKEPQEGTGLGLSTVYGIVTEAGGQISVGDSPLGGAQFTVRLPRVSEKRGEPGSAASATRSGKGECIFLLEDEDSVRNVVRRILEKGGYRVVTEADPAAAVEHLRQEGDVDLLLSDIVMPGMHGPEVYEELRRLKPDLRALFMSGYSEEATLEKVGGLPSTVISKPFRPEELLRAVARVLNQ